MFAPHENLSDRINGNIIRSEIEGGVDLRQLPPESKLKVETRNRAYTIVMKRDCDALISGHPDFCPFPGAGAHPWIELGRFHAQNRVFRARNASGVPPPDV